MLFWSLGINVTALIVSLIIGWLVPTNYGGFGITAVFVVAILSYNLFSLKKIGPTELGELLLFGKPIKDLGSGLVYAPLVFTTIVRESKLVIQEQYPDEPEKVWKGDESQRPPDKVPPIRVTHAGDPDDADPLKRRMTTEVSIIVRYRIDDYKTFLTTIGSTDAARQQIRDAVTAKVREDLAKKTPAETLAQLGTINVELRAHVEAIVQSWGVTVEDVRLEDLDLGKTVNTNLRSIPAAELEKKRIVTLSEAAMKKSENEGLGTARAEEAMLNARARGNAKNRELTINAEGRALSNLASKPNLSDSETKQLVLGVQLLAPLFKEANPIVLSGTSGIGDLIAAAKVLAGTKEKPTTGSGRGKKGSKT